MRKIKKLALRLVYSKYYMIMMIVLPLPIFLQADAGVESIWTKVWMGVVALSLAIVTANVTTMLQTKVERRKIPSNVHQMYTYIKSKYNWRANRVLMWYKLCTNCVQL